jgi:hypothetical protein
MRKFMTYKDYQLLLGYLNVSGLHGLAEIKSVYRIMVGELLEKYLLGRLRLTLRLISWRQIARVRVDGTRS